MGKYVVDRVKSCLEYEESLEWNLGSVMMDSKKLIKGFGTA